MLRVELDGAQGQMEWRGGEHVRAKVFGEGPVEWKLYWWAKGEQSSTDHDVVVAKGRGEASPEGMPIDVELPEGALPSHRGALFSVLWRLDVWPEGRRVPAPGEPDEEVRVAFKVRAGPPPKRLDPWVDGWRRWTRGERRETVVRRLLFAGLAVVGAAVLASFAVGAAFLPPLHALGVLALVGLTVVGAVAASGSRVSRWVRETRANYRMGVSTGPVALLGEELDATVRVDARRAMASGGLTWRLRCVEHTAKRVDYSHQGSARTRYDWKARVAHEIEGALPGPPYGRRRFTVPIPADAPPTLTAAHRQLLWTLEVRCGDDAVATPVFVAPFAGHPTRI